MKEPAFGGGTAETVAVTVRIAAGDTLTITSDRNTISTCWFLPSGALLSMSMSSGISSCI